MHGAAVHAEQGCAGQSRQDGGVGGQDELRPCLGQPVQLAQKGQLPLGGQGGLRLVRQVQPRRDGSPPGSDAGNSPSEIVGGGSGRRSGRRSPPPGRRPGSPRPGWPRCRSSPSVAGPAAKPDGLMQGRVTVTGGEAVVPSAASGGQAQGVPSGSAPSKPRAGMARRQLSGTRLSQSRETAPAAARSRRVPPSG